MSRLDVAIDFQQGPAERARDQAPYQRSVTRGMGKPLFMAPWLLDQKLAASER